MRHADIPIMDKHKSQEYPPNMVQYTFSVLLCHKSRSGCIADQLRFSRVSAGYSAPRRARLPQILTYSRNMSRFHRHLLT